jgi:hypothetical protein
MVRAVVNAMRPTPPETSSGGSFRPGANRYIELAARLICPPLPRLILMHGFSGSGKTWLSDRLVGDWRALRVRSDLERKRLMGADRTERLAGGFEQGAYGTEITDRTYETVAGHCETGLRAGITMIADATFLHRRHRKLFFEMGRRVGVPVSIVDCPSDIETLRRNIALRSAADTDASDADIAVLEQQLRHHDPLDDSELQRILSPETEL